MGRAWPLASHAIKDPFSCHQVRYQVIERRAAPKLVAQVDRFFPESPR